MAVITPTRVDGPRRTTITWTSITTADTGASVDVSDLEDIKAVQIVGAGSAQIRGSNDGTNFANFGAALTTNTIQNVTLSSKFLDVNPVTVGTATVIIHAFRRRG